MPWFDDTYLQISLTIKEFYDYFEQIKKNYDLEIKIAQSIYFGLYIAVQIYLCQDWRHKQIFFIYSQIRTFIQGKCSIKAAVIKKELNDWALERESCSKKTMQSFIELHKIYLSGEGIKH